MNFFITVIIVIAADSAIKLSFYWHEISHKIVIAVLSFKHVYINFSSALCLAYVSFP